LLDRFYNDLSANPDGIDEQTRNHYAEIYAMPGAIHDAFSGQFAAFAQDALDNQSERIRDKFAASRRKGMWMGGNVPFGYRVENRKLLIQEDEAAIVRSIFERFLQIGSATILARTLNAEGLGRKNGKAFDKGLLYKLLSNRVYMGDAVHKGASYPGEHQPIISLDLWDKVRSMVAESPSKRAGQSRRQTPALLKGLIFAPSGYAMTPVHTRKKGKLYHERA
jgi:hypothetical protein